MNRRKFMEWGIYAVGGSIAAVSGITLVRFAVGPSFEKEREKWVYLKLKDFPLDRPGFQRVVLEYERKDGWTVETARNLVYMKRSKDDGIVVISAVCTHLGCIVTWDGSRRVFRCPCHDGVYDAEGKVIGGPPPVALMRHPVKSDGRGISVRAEPEPFEGDDVESV